MDNEAKLALLRLNLFTAPQQLRGADLDEFWRLIDEVLLTRKLHPPSYDLEADPPADEDKERPDGASTLGTFSGI